MSNEFSAGDFDDFIDKMNIHDVQEDLDEAEARSIGKFIVDENILLRIAVTSLKDGFYGCLNESTIRESACIGVAAAMASYIAPIGVSDPYKARYDALTAATRIVGQAAEIMTAEENGLPINIEEWEAELEPYRYILYDIMLVPRTAVTTLRIISSFFYSQINNILPDDPEYPPENEVFYDYGVTAALFLANHKYVPMAGHESVWRPEHTDIDTLRDAIDSAACAITNMVVYIIPDYVFEDEDDEGNSEEPKRPFSVPSQMNILAQSNDEGLAIHRKISNYRISRMFLINSGAIADCAFLVACLLSLPTTHEDVDLLHNAMFGFVESKGES